MEAKAWRTITPDAHGDWLKQRDDSFARFIALGDKEEKEPRLIETFAHGVVTGRDAWCFNASRSALAQNMSRMIAFYNQEQARFKKTFDGKDKATRQAAVNESVDGDLTRISWTRALKRHLVDMRTFKFNEDCIRPCLYRPFTKGYLYLDKVFNEAVSLNLRLFPDVNAKNIVIGVSAFESRSAYSVFITDQVASFHAVDMVGSQFFPLYLYDEPHSGNGDDRQRGLLLGGDGAGKRRDGITDLARIIHE